MAGKNKIQFTLISYLLILLIGAVLSTAYFVFKISEYQLIKETESKLLAINTSKANSVKNYFNESFKSIEKVNTKYNRYIYDYLTHQYSNDENEVEKVNSIKKFLKNTLTTIKNEHQYHNIGILRISGESLIIPTGFKSLKPLISREEKIYREAQNKVVITSTYELNRRKYVSIIAPIKYSESRNKGSKKTIALIIIEIDLEPVFQILNNETGIGELGETVVVNEVKNIHTRNKIHFFISPPKSFPELISQNVQTKGYNSEAITSSFKTKKSGFLGPTIDYKGSNTFASWDYIEKLNWAIITFIPSSTSKKVIKELKSMVQFLIMSILLLSSLILVIIITRYTKTLPRIKNFIKSINKGTELNKIECYRNDEIKEIIVELKQLSTKHEKFKNFTQNIASGNLDIELIEESENQDELSKNLLAVKDKLSEINAENERRKWASNGFATHAEIMMEHSRDLKTLGMKLISSIVNYLGAHQGAIFTIKKINNDRYEDDPSKTHTGFELIASYAFSDTKATKAKLFQLGQGLVGQCALEKKTIYLENTPLVQSNVESGLGEAPATDLLLIPLKINEEVLGVLEIGAFKHFKKHEIEFLEQLGESIASSLLTLISNNQTTEILKENQMVLTLLKEKEKEVLETQSHLVDLLDTLQKDYNNAQQEIIKLKKEVQNLSK